MGKEYEYGVKYAGSTVDSGKYLSANILKKMGGTRPGRLLISSLLRYCVFVSMVLLSW